MSIRERGAIEAVHGSNNSVSHFKAIASFVQPFEEKEKL